MTRATQGLHYGKGSSGSIKNTFYTRSNPGTTWSNGFNTFAVTWTSSSITCEQGHKPREARRGRLACAGHAALSVLGCIEDYRAAPSITDPLEMYQLAALQVWSPIQCPAFPHVARPTLQSPSMATMSGRCRARASTLVAGSPRHPTPPPMHHLTCPSTSSCECLEGKEVNLLVWTPQACAHLRDGRAPPLPSGRSILGARNRARQSLHILLP